MDLSRLFSLNVGNLSSDITNIVQPWIFTLCISLDKVLKFAASIAEDEKLIAKFKRDEDEKLKVCSHVRINTSPSSKSLPSDNSYTHTRMHTPRTHIHAHHTVYIHIGTVQGGLLGVM